MINHIETIIDSLRRKVRPTILARQIDNLQDLILLESRSELEQDATPGTDFFQEPRSITISIFSGSIN